MKLHHQDDEIRKNLRTPSDTVKPTVYENDSVNQFWYLMYVCLLSAEHFILFIYLFCCLLIFLFRFCFPVFFFFKFKKSHSYVPYESRGEHQFCIGVSVLVAHQLFDKTPQRVMPPLSHQLLDAFAEYNNNAGA